MYLVAPIIVLKPAFVTIAFFSFPSICNFLGSEAELAILFRVGSCLQMSLHAHQRLVIEAAGLLFISHRNYGQIFTASTQGFGVGLDHVK